MEIDLDDELFAADGDFDLVEMIKDESEDEDEQVNMEINGHLSEPIDIIQSHKYREEIKTKYYSFSNLSK